MLRRALWRAAAAATHRPLRTLEPAAAETLTAAGHHLPSSRHDVAGPVRRWTGDAPSRDTGEDQRRRDAGADAVGSSVDAAETAKFARVADHWWDVEKGPFAPLHTMSPVRCAFIRQALCAHFALDATAVEPFRGLRLLDVGCGGGLLCEPMARLGGEVLGVDAVAHSVSVAEAHAQRDATVAPRVAYRAATAEQLVAEGLTFDAVLSLEVIEHVADPRAFVASLAALVRPGGLLVVSTINRTPTSYALGVLAAEHVLRWVPAGTHEWSKFVTPEEMRSLTAEAGLQMQQLSGMVFNPLSSMQWTLDEGDTSMNYIAYATKPPDLSDSR